MIDRSMHLPKALLRVVFYVALTAHCGASPFLSPEQLVYSPTDKTLYVTAATGKSVIAVNSSSNRITRVFKLPDNPSGLAVSKDGHTLFVTVGVATGKLVVIDTATGDIKKQIPVGHSPVAPVVTADNHVVYIANRFADRVTKVSLQTGAVVATAPATREPIGMVLSNDESTLFVANHLPKGAANGDHISAEINVIDTASFKLKKSIKLPNGAISVRSITCSPDGKWLYVPSYIARYSVPTTQLERGWMNTAALNILDAASESLYHSLLLDDVDQGAANPWQVTTSADNRTLCITHSSVHEVSLIDRKKLFATLKLLPSANSLKTLTAYETQPGSPVNRLDMMVGIRQRIPIKGNAPRGIVAIDGKVITANYFTDTLTSIDMTGSNKVSVIPLQKPQPMTEARKGEMYFNDASYCFQKWQSCASCHPGSRADAVNWDLLNDGIGNPKNTKSLLLSHQTPPVMITGIRPDAETAVRAGIRYIMFTPVDESRASALDTYLRSLKPIPSPQLINGKLSPSALRGKKVFTEAGCNLCHTGSTFTDGKSYDVGTATDGLDKGRKFDTPTLVEVWRTAPYLFDGRAANLNEVFTKYNTGDNHGFTSELSDDKLTDLINYINSL